MAVTIDKLVHATVGGKWVISLNKGRHKFIYGSSRDQMGFYVLPTYALRFTSKFRAETWAWLNLQEYETAVIRLKELE